MQEKGFKHMFNNTHEATEAYRKFEQLRSELDMNCTIDDRVAKDRLEEFNRVWVEIKKLMNVNIKVSDG